MGIATDLANDILTMSRNITSLSSSVVALQNRVQTLNATTASLNQQILAKDATITSLNTQISSLQQKISSSVVIVPSVTASAPVTAPSPSSSSISVEPQVGVPFTWTMPISGKSVTFTPKNVIKNQLFVNQTGTALTLEIDHIADNTIYYKCNFVGAAYALWMDHQNNIVFIDCTFTDMYANTEEQSTVRVEDCTNIYFLNPTIEAYGDKHAFRVHGFSATIGVKGMKANSRGNGMMLGGYLGAAAGSQSVRELEICDIYLRTRGPDVFDPKRDGSLLNFKVKNMLVEFSPPGWDSPADVKANPYAGWTIENLTSKQV